MILEFKLEYNNLEYRGVNKINIPDMIQKFVG